MWRRAVVRGTLGRIKDRAGADKVEPSDPSADRTGG